MLAVGGVVSFLLGSLILFQPGLGGCRVSLAVIARRDPGHGRVLPVRRRQSGLRAQRRRVTTGAEGLVGEIGEAVTALAPRGQVRVHGEIWKR